LEYCETRDWEADAVAYANQERYAANHRNVRDAKGGSGSTVRPSQPPRRGFLQGSYECSVDPKKEATQWGEREWSELERYLAMPTVDTDVDVLEWWKRNARAFPGLAP
jgi:hypothetical protein